MIKTTFLLFFIFTLSSCNLLSTEEEKSPPKSDSEVMKTDNSLPKEKAVEVAKIKNVISITEPMFSFKTTESEDKSGGKFILTTASYSESLYNETHLDIVGTSDSNISEIRVLFKNEGFNLEDDYSLTKFSVGDTEWKYVIDTRYDNLTTGENFYSVQAFTGEGDLKKLVGKIEFIINANISAKTVEVPERSSIDVDFLAEPLKIDTRKFLDSIGYESIYEYNQNRSAIF